MRLGPRCWSSQEYMVRRQRQNDCSQCVTKSHARLLLIGCEFDGGHRTIRENEKRPLRGLKGVPPFAHQRLAQTRRALLQTDEVVVRRAILDVGAVRFYEIPQVVGKDEVSVS